MQITNRFGKKVILAKMTDRKKEKSKPEITSTESEFVFDFCFFVSLSKSVFT